MRYILALIAVVTLTAFGPCGGEEETQEETTTESTE